jgi:16S rRNA (cytosine967-C5)-methyltransferase
MRRKPDIKYNALEDLAELENTQRQILHNAASVVKKGGRILYSTCTLRKAENEEAVRAFLNENKNAVLKFEHTFMPHTDNTDGFYTALIEMN